MSGTNVSFTITASDKTQAAFNSVNAGLGALKSKSDTLFSAFSGGVAGGLATGLLGAGFTTAMKGAIDDLDKLNDASERLGISVEDLSALNFAGKMNGLEFDDMTTALTKLSVKMQEAASGGKEAVALFGDMGIKVTDASGKLKSADSVFADIADYFARVEDPAGEAALAVDAFGKSGAKLVPILNGGADGLKKMREEAASLGGIIDSKLAKQAAEFNDNMDKLALASKHVSVAIAGDLLPSLTDTSEKFIELVKEGNKFEALMRGLAGIGKLPFDFLIGGSAPDLSVDTRIKELRSELASLQRGAEQVKNGGLLNQLVYGGSAEEIGQKITVTKNQIDALVKFKDQLEFKTKTGGTAAVFSGGTTAITRTSTADKKTGNAAKEIAEASAEATAYGKAMESLAKLTGDADAAHLDLTKSQKTLYDLMTSAEWASMPAAWKQTAGAQFETAYAAEQAAASTKLLNDMLGETESAGIEKARSDMLLLVAALEKGTITEQQYVEAATARLKLKGNEDAKAGIAELDEFTKSAARNMQSSLADFIFDPFAAGTKDMASQFGLMLQRMAAEAAAASIMKNVLGSQGSTANGGSGDWGWVGQAASWVGAFFADGGVMTSDGPVPLRKYAGGGIASSPQLAMFGEGSNPEAYVPLPDGRRIPVAMQGNGAGRPIVINVNSSTGDKAEIRRSTAAGARAALGAMGGAQRYA